MNRYFFIEMNDKNIEIKNYGFYIINEEILFIPHENYLAIFFL